MFAGPDFRDRDFDFFFFFLVTRGLFLAWGTFGGVRCIMDLGVDAAGGWCMGVGRCSILWLERF